MNDDERRTKAELSCERRDYGGSRSRSDRHVINRGAVMNEVKSIAVPIGAFLLTTGIVIMLFAVEW